MHQLPAQKQALSSGSVPGLLKGFAWKKNGIKKDQVLEKNKHITDASQALWQYANSIINESVEKGYLAEI